MTPIPISVQLYSVREDAKKDFPAVLKRIAGMGYVGVEFAGLHGFSPKDVRAMIDDLGLVASSTHGPMPNEANAAEVIETAKILGYTRHISGFGRDQFATKEKALEAGAIANKATEVLKGSGITFGLHNHDFEFSSRFDGKYGHEIMMAAAPKAFAELDTYWIKVGGADPAAIVKQYGARAPLLHIKDGPCNREQSMTAVGKGIMPWKEVIGAAAPSTEWLVVELDRCDTDMMEAVAESCRYLVDNGFAKGRK